MGCTRTPRTAAESASAVSWRPRSSARAAVRRDAELSANGKASAAIARSESTTRTTRTRRPTSGVQPETESAHRLQRKPGELRPDLSDEEVQRPRPANYRGSPNLEHQLLTADRLPLARGQHRQERKFRLGKRAWGALHGDFPAIAVDGDRPCNHRCSVRRGVALRGERVA